MYSSLEKLRPRLEQFTYLKDKKIGVEFVDSSVDKTIKTHLALEKSDHLLIFSNNFH